MPHATFRESFVPKEIDTYFDMMDSDRDEKLSMQELEKGFAVLCRLMLGY